MFQDNGGRFSPDLIETRYDETYNPREGELERVFTEEELITLCKQKKCCVEMHRWNPVYEFYWQLKRKGKIENMEPHKIKKLLIKLGSRYKNCPRRSYSLKEIEMERTWDWKMRKCFNGRWLDEQNITAQSSKRDNMRAEPKNYMNYKPRQMVSHKELVSDCSNLDNTEENEATETSINDLYSLNQLENAAINGISSESVLNIFTESENYESFHVAIPLTSTQSQEVGG